MAMRVGFVGWRGMVGSVLMQRMGDERDFELIDPVFFSTSNFPGWMRPLVAALPLTALNDALRAIMNDGRPLYAIWLELAVLAIWGIMSFGVALKIFKWQ